MSEKKPCGPHVVLAQNDGAKISRCACGTVHVHFARVGVTVQVTDGQLAELARAVSAAMEPQESIAVASAEELQPGTFVGVKKPTLN
jgi:hypothetical protein